MGRTVGVYEGTAEGRVIGDRALAERCLVGGKVHWTALSASSGAVLAVSVLRATPVLENSVNFTSALVAPPLRTRQRAKPLD